MTRWLQAAKAALPPADKTDETDKTIPGCVTSMETTSGGVSSVSSVLSEGGVSGFPPGTPAVLSFQPKPSAPETSRPDADAFRHGRSVAGDPLTWTGRVVSLADWAKLSDWERHGSTGKRWNGHSLQSEPTDGGAA